MPYNFKSIIEGFDIKGKFVSAVPYGSGHINDSFLIITDEEPPNKYLLQRINTDVFQKPDRLCYNNFVVIREMQDFYKNKPGRIPLKLFPIKRTKWYHFFTDADGNIWRLLNFIENSEAFEIIENTEIAYEAAKAFGEFQTMLKSFNPQIIYKTIYFFHNINKRIKDLKRAVKQDKYDRRKFAEKEINFVINKQHLSDEVSYLMSTKKIRERVTHNDTKLNNVLFDKDSSKALCVIDLDTVMPGSILYDFGDMVRTFTSPVSEDETDLNKVKVRLEIFEALSKGYLYELKDILTKTEKENLILGAKLMTYIIGIRFLTDYLNGDKYFKIHHPNQNLDRCRNQFKLLSSIEEQETEMQDILKKYI